MTPDDAPNGWYRRGRVPELFLAARFFFFDDWRLRRKFPACILPALKVLRRKYLVRDRPCLVTLGRAVPGGKIDERQLVVPGRRVCFQVLIPTCCSSLRKEDRKMRNLKRNYAQTRPQLSCGRTGGPTPRNKACPRRIPASVPASRYRAGIRGGKVS